MADIEVFIQEIRRSVPNGDEFSMQDAIVRAARIFCQKSWYVRRQVIFQTAVPAQPKNVYAIPGNAQVQLRWDAVPNATGYTINVSTTSGQEKPSVSLLPQAGGIVPNLSNDTLYYFTVQATNGVGASLASAELTATPASSLANAPLGGTPAVMIYSQDLNLAADEEVIGVKAAQCGTWPLAAATPRDMDPKFGPGRPRGFAFAPNKHFMLYPVPNAIYDIMLLAPVQPILGATQLADEIEQQFLEGIGYGALKWLYGMPGTPWENQQQAGTMSAMFDDEIQRAKRMALADFQAGNMRVQAAPFIIRSIC